MIPDMPSRLCPYCKTVADLAPAWSTSEFVGHSQNMSRQYLVRVACICTNCRHLSIAVVNRSKTAAPSGTASDHLRSLVEQETVSSWTPLAASAPDFDRVPEHVAKCAQQAHMTHNIGADMASILMTRTTIEATAKSKGITSGNLYSKIEAMADQGIIRRDALTVAHAIRQLGNDMAHGDVEDPPTPEDAADALQLMDLILSEVYQATSLAQEILQRRKG
jgi:hypothetical protein